MPGDRSSHRTVAAWVARLNADDRTAADEAAFRRWLHEHPDNAARFERATDLWAMVPGAASARGPLVTRRRALAGLATLSAVAGSATIAIQAAHAGTAYRTGIGEQRHVALADGSAALLDADTRLRIGVAAGRRWLTLARGRVGLSVAPGASFTIEAGAGVFDAAAGRFDVSRRADGVVAFTTIEGEARSALAGARRLRPGDRLRLGDRRAVVDQPELAATDAWRSGRAAFHEDTLRTVADEANRYSSTRLLIADPRTAALRVSGMYRVGDNRALGRSLAILLSLPLRTVDGAVVLGAPPEKSPRGVG